MLRFGITDAAGLARPATLFGQPREIAVPVLWRALLDSKDRPAPACVDAFNRLRVGGGVYKRTAPGRFDDVRSDVAAALGDLLRGASPLRVHDLGVSDGTTSVELHEDLKRAGFELRFVMSDAYDRIWVVRPAGSRWTCVLDADLRPLQYYSRRFVLAADPPSWRLPVNRWVHRSVIRREAPRVREVAERLRAGSEASARAGGASVEQIPLVGRAATDLLGRDPNVTFVRHDVTKPIEGRFHFIRAMNVLNRAYFDEATLRAAVAHVREALEPGGAFLAGRSIDEQDGRTAATLFRRGSRGFEILRRFHEGSEIEPFAG
jgi:hypothetical protein